MQWLRHNDTQRSQDNSKGYEEHDPEEKVQSQLGTGGTGYSDSLKATCLDQSGTSQRVF